MEEICKHGVCKLMRELEGPVKKRVKIAIVTQNAGRYYLVVTNERGSPNHSLPGGHITEENVCYYTELKRELDEELHESFDIDDEWYKATSVSKSAYTQSLILYKYWSAFDAPRYNDKIYRYRKSSDRALSEVACLREVDIVTLRTPEGLTIKLSNIVMHAIAQIREQLGDKLT